MLQLKHNEGKNMSSRWGTSAFNHEKKMYEYECILSGVKKLLAIPSLQLFCSLWTASLKAAWQQSSSLTIWIKKGQKMVFSCKTLKMEQWLKSTLRVSWLYPKAFLSSERASWSEKQGEMGVVWITKKKRKHYAHEAENEIHLDERTGDLPTYWFYSVWMENSQRVRGTLI